jgi:hypothetical protein
MNVYQIMMMIFTRLWDARADYEDVHEDGQLYMETS